MAGFFQQQQDWLQQQKQDTDQPIDPASTGWKTSPWQQSMKAPNQMYDLMPHVSGTPTVDKQAMGDAYQKSMQSSGQAGFLGGAGQQAQNLPSANSGSVANITNAATGSAPTELTPATNITGAAATQNLLGGHYWDAAHAVGEGALLTTIPGYNAVNQKPKNAGDVLNDIFAFGVL